MVSILKRISKKISCVSSRGGNAVSRDMQPTQSVRRSQTPPSAALELELAKQRAECARLELEYQRTKAEADAFADVKGKLEDELREVKELLEARGNEVGKKDTNIQQLESEMKTKVGHVGGGQIPTADIFAIPFAKLNELRTTLTHTQELSTRLSEKDRLLSERTMELSAARAFLTRVDAVSEAEVVGMVENLNALISSASSALAATWDQQEPVPGTLVDEPSFKRVRDYFGNLMFEEIAARNSVAVTLAFEVYLVQFVEQVTSGWGGGVAAGVLGEIYEMISAEGEVGAHVGQS